MIPSHLRKTISKKLEEVVGFDSEVGDFIFKFSYLDASRDAEYALELADQTTNEKVRTAINIILTTIADDYGQRNLL